MTDEKRPAGAESAKGGKQNSGPRITRRRFTKAGAAAPLVMTLGSRPVWGQCVTPSGNQSGEASSARDPDWHQAPGSGGHSVNYWLNHPSKWLVTVPLDSALIYTVTCPPSSSRKVAIVSPDIEGLWAGFASGGVHAEIAAAILNSRDTSLDFGYEEQDILALDSKAEYTSLFLSCLNARSGDSDAVVVTRFQKVQSSSTPPKCYAVDSISFIEVAVADLLDVTAYAVATLGNDNICECDV